MKVDLIWRSKDLADLKENWDALYERDPEAHYFLSWPFLSSFLRRFDGSWFVLAARQDPEASAYAALLPLRFKAKMNLKTGQLSNEIHMGGSYASDYTGFLAAPEFADRASVAFARHLKTMHWAKLHLENLRMSEERRGSFLAELQDEKLNLRKLRRVNAADKVDNCVCLSAELAESWELFLERNLSSNTRQKMRRFLRKVETSDDFRITHADASTIERDVETLLRFWSVKWSARKENPTAILKSSRAFFKETWNGGSLFLPVLWHLDKPICALALLADPVKKTMLFYMAGRDETDSAVPSGLVLHGYCIRRAIEQGYRTYDFLRGNEPYKYSFGTRESAIHCFLMQTKSGRNLGDRLEKGSLAGACQQAQKLHKDRKLAQAEYAYRQVLETDPHYPDALYGLGQLLTLKGDHHEAAERFQTLSTIAPETAKVWHRLGAALQALEDHAGAVEALRKATELKPEFAAAQYCLGVSLLKLGQRTEAADILAATIGQPVQSQSDNVWRTKAQALLDHVKRDEEQQSGRGVPAG
ncbi:MAG: GNAT family N-acetyltransferase [Mesorhizobium sp.]